MSGNQQKATGSKALQKKPTKPTQDPNEVPLLQFVTDIEAAGDTGFDQMNTKFATLKTQATSYRDPKEAERNDVYINEAGQETATKLANGGVDLLRSWCSPSYSALPVLERHRIKRLKYNIEFLITEVHANLWPPFVAPWERIKRDVDEDGAGELKGIQRVRNIIDTSINGNSTINESENQQSRNMFGNQSQKGSGESSKKVLPKFPPGPEHKWKDPNKPIEECFEEFQEKMDSAIMTLNINQYSSANETLALHRQRVEAGRNDIYINEKDHAEVSKVTLGGIGILEEFRADDLKQYNVEVRYLVGYFARYAQCVARTNQVVVPPRFKEMLGLIVREIFGDAELETYVLNRRRDREAAARAGQAS
ncbi:hypothetical protein PRZ48_001151 [Zasmidium cellare]|uniref:Uncharacterized protein n=1 Tax=Zasmidium cellare TaxID=395010 RepID=A0ABR0F215_ZASCE|nr:hypothetical protein PRZ48_001151 [Zasmidium cellare]